MRKFPVLALLVLAIPAPAMAAHRLSLTRAKHAAAKIAAHDAYLNRFAPDWTGAATAPKCVRKSRTGATCDYQINYTRTDPTQRGYARFCKRRVVVTLNKRGRAVARLMTNLDCVLQDINKRDPDYEA